MNQRLPDLKQVAQKLIKAGFSVIPCLPNKKPAIPSWKEYQTRFMTPAEVERFFAGAERIAVIGGGVSGNLEILDFDDPATYEPFLNLVEAREEKLVGKLPQRQTPSGGYHIYFRSTTLVKGNQVLARDNAGQVRIETRGERGYAISSPSPGYKVVEHSLIDCPVLTELEVEILHSTARVFDQRALNNSNTFAYKGKDIGDARPGDLFNQEHSVAEMLEKYGWSPDQKTTAGIGYTRPGKANGTSGVLFADTGNFYCFSTNANPLEPEKSYDAFALCVAYEHGGEYSAAARFLASKQKPATIARPKETLPMNIVRCDLALEPEDIQVLRGALAIIPPDIKFDRHTSSQIIGWGLRHAESGIDYHVGGSLCTEWDRLTGGTSLEIFTTSDPHYDHTQPVTAASIFALAKQHGWTPEREINGKPKQWEPTTPDWPTMDKKAYRGLAADFINLATRNSEADPAAILGTFLVRFGVEIGPDVFMNVGDTKHRARLAAVIVGASSKARKGTSGKPVARLFKFADIPGLNLYNTARTSKGPFSSGEGIVFAIRDPATRWSAKDQVEEIVDNGVEDKRLFVLDEEFGGVLANTKREGNTLSMIIRQAWDSGNFDPLTKNNKTTATGGHVGWVSHITLQELHAKLGESEGFNGFANRIQWICAKRQKLVPLPQPMPGQELLDIQRRMAIILSKLQGGFEVELGDAARSAWCERYYADLTKDRQGLVGCITNRGEAQALRLAMIYCLLDGERVISLEHLEAGIAFWDYCRQSANYIFHGRQTDNTAQTIVEALKKGPMSGTQIHALFNNHLNKERLESVLSELIASNQVILEKQEGFNGKGRPTKLYRIYETPCELSEKSELNSREDVDEPIKFANSLNSQEDLSDSEVF